MVSQLLLYINVTVSPLVKFMKPVSTLTGIWLVKIVLADAPLKIHELPPLINMSFFVTSNVKYACASPSSSLLKTLNSLKTVWLFPEASVFTIDTVKSKSMIPVLFGISLTESPSLYLYPGWYLKPVSCTTVLVSSCPALIIDVFINLFIS